MRHYLPRQLGAIEPVRAGAAWPTITPAASTIPARARYRLGFGLVLGGLIPIVAIVVGTAALVSEFRDRGLADGEREFKNTALILAGQTDRAFQALQLVEDSIVE